MPRHPGSVTKRGEIAAQLVVQRDELLAFVLRRVGQRALADDLVQQVAARALAHADQLRDASSGRAWLFRIARNLIAEHARRHGPEEVTLSEQEVSVEPEAEPGCSCVLSNVQQLKREYADILTRVIVQGAAVTAVAAELGISPSAAMVRVHRARHALRARLRRHCGTSSRRACLSCACAERGCCDAQPASVSAP